ncbi:hypothetical protein ACTXT7_004988 [Hymenolepis weldensis]
MTAGLMNGTSFEPSAFEEKEKEAYTKSCLTQIYKDAKEVFGLAGPSWVIRAKNCKMRNCQQYADISREENNALVL